MRCSAHLKQPQRLADMTQTEDRTDTRNCGPGGTLKTISCDIGHEIVLSGSHCSIHPLNVTPSFQVLQQEEIKNIWRKRRALWQGCHPSLCSRRSMSERDLNTEGCLNSLSGCSGLKNSGLLDFSSSVATLQILTPPYTCNRTPEPCKYEH